MFLESRQCPLWVKSRHVQCTKPMSALPPKADMCSALSVCPLCAKSGHWSLFRQGSFPQAFLKSREVFRSTKRSPFLDVANAQRGIELA